ncbi:RNA polymerase I associated factor, A49-like protein [Aureobasidium sp. EXF-8845]|nr:RNA polymerase I associated factor, A49-like protein [Aureobasidium sp. EXF-8846]KAI4798223.1 RNA polymerase I associated factor, A49-like protein [Aureobasidium sp. EXF-8845]
MAAHDDKKRKRAAEGADGPNKKASSAAITVRFPASRDELHPVIAAAPGLNVPAAPFKPFVKVTNSKKEGVSPAPSTHSLLLHSTSHARLDFTAQQQSSQDIAHYVAVYDPQSSSLQVIPAHPVTLRTTLRAEAQEVAAQKAARTYAQQREDLGQAFGTKKAKKALASKVENAITTNADRNRVGGKLDNVESAVMDSVKEASDAMPAKQAQQEEILASKPIPKPNLNATEAENVYPIGMLIPATDMRNLTVKEWQDANGEDLKLSSRFVAHRVNPIAVRDDVQRLKALKYLMLLIEFNLALKPAGKAGKKVPQKDQLRSKLEEWPETLIESVRRRFSDNNELNKWHMDNLITHMAAISLFIDGYKTDTHDLREDLRLENKQMSQYFMELGCKVNNPTEKEQADFKIPNKAVAAQRRVAKLKLPLDFPKVRMMPRRR